jgi:hypothetical protein
MCYNDESYDNRDADARCEHPNQGEVFLCEAHISWFNDHGTDGFELIEEL